jgi:Mrp family chromosome partitioning ATPase
MLLDSPRVASLVKELKEHYDFVIFDTPPVVGLTDAQVLSVNTDGMVLLVALERSNRSALQRATEVLKGGSTPVLGLIVNLLDEGNEGYYYQYYYSYYGEPMPNGNGNGSANSNKNGARKRTNVDKGNALTNLFKPKNK